MDKRTASRLGQNKPAKDVYQLLQQHHKHVGTAICPRCYAKGDSLMVEYSIIEHIIALSMEEYTYIDILDIVNDLIDLKLIKCLDVREGLIELKFLQLQKPAKAKEKAA